LDRFKGVDSKFRLVILAARRSKQLIAGSKKRVEIKAENPLTVALEEFRQGKIDFEILKEEESLLKLNELNEASEGEPAAAVASEEGVTETDENSETAKEEKDTEPL